jgi:biotin transport system substrate-specific component
MGFPVLPGARGGLGVLLGPTGGFLVGMIPGAMLVGWLAARHAVAGNPKLHFVRNALAALAGGVAMVYLIGVPWLAIVTGMPFAKAINVVVVFLPGDFIKALVAAALAQRVNRFLV